MFRRIASAPLVRPTLAGLLAAALAAPLGPAATAAPSDGSGDRLIRYQAFDSAEDFARGRLRGVRVVRDGELRIRRPIGKTRYADPHGGGRARYAFGHWTSRWVRPGFGLTELIPSWDADVRRDAFVEVRVRGRVAPGQRSSWDTVARWAPGDETFSRTTTPSGAESDDLARVATDTWQANSSLDFSAYKIRVVLYRRVGTRSTPFVDTIGAVASNLPQVADVPTSRPGVARGFSLRLPRYSQMIHTGHYPEFGNGGEAWCSPTSVSMVLGYYDALPSAEQYAWVGDDHRNPWVDHAARMVYDYEYDGAGNWAFNTAYAAQHTDNAFVTRMESLRDVERFIRAGIPVVASVAFGPGELDGAPISSTAGHLMVIVGFTEEGDVRVNDPAAPRNRSVRRTYDRGQFENAWLPTSGGLAYVIHTDEQELPPRKTAGGW